MFLPLHTHLFLKISTALVANRYFPLFWGPSTKAFGGKNLVIMDYAFFMFLEDEQQTGQVRTVLWDWGFEGTPAVSVQAPAVLCAGFQGEVEILRRDDSRSKLMPCASVFLHPLKEPRADCCKLL